MKQPLSERLRAWLTDNGYREKPSPDTEYTIWYSPNRDDYLYLYKNGDMRYTETGRFTDAYNINSTIRSRLIAWERKQR